MEKYPINYYYFNQLKRLVDAKLEVIYDGKIEGIQADKYISYISGVKQPDFGTYQYHLLEDEGMIVRVSGSMVMSNCTYLITPKGKELIAFYRSDGCVLDECDIKVLEDAKGYDDSRPHNRGILYRKELDVAFSVWYKRSVDIRIFKTLLKNNFFTTSTMPDVYLLSEKARALVSYL